MVRIVERRAKLITGLAGFEPAFPNSPYGIWTHAVAVKVRCATTTPRGNTLDFDYWLKPPTHLSRLTAIKVSCRTLRLSSLKDCKIRHIILRRKQWTSHRLSPIFGHLDYPLCTGIIAFIQLGKTPSGGFEPPHLLQPIALAMRPLQPDLSKTANNGNW